MKKLFRRKSADNKTYPAKKQKSLVTYIWICFMLFTIIILFLLWFFQYFFIEMYYQSMKVRDLKSCAEQISENIDSYNLDGLINSLAFQNSATILITDTLGNVEHNANYLGRFSYFNADVEKFGQYIYKFRNKLLNSGKKSVSEIYENKETESKELFYATKIEINGSPKLLFLESSIEPVDSTTKIIKEQLIFITFILFELAFIIALFISKKIARPIVKITESAEEFAEGNYDVKFDGKGYEEVQELSNVLNHAGREVKKVTDLRRDLIANVSHDLRTPLTMIKAYAEMIRDLSGDNPEKRAEHIQVIIDESDRLAFLVNDILELSKLESSNAELALSEFSIFDKMQDVLSRYQILIERDGYNIKYYKDEDRICLADEAKIEQVLYNLINNAVNYCGDDKTVIIRQINKKDSVRIEVIDHGEGISKELMPLVFDRYYRDKKVARDKVGTGIGLSIVKGILNSHEFPFGVSSEEGKGSMFWFEMTDTKSVFSNTSDKNSDNENNKDIK